jgi:hypothetical protein
MRLGQRRRRLRTTPGARACANSAVSAAAGGRRRAPSGRPRRDVGLARLRRRRQQEVDQHLRAFLRAGVERDREEVRVADACPPHAAS